MHRTFCFKYIVIKMIKILYLKFKTDKIAMAYLLVEYF